MHFDSSLKRWTAAGLLAALALATLAPAAEAGHARWIRYRGVPEQGSRASHRVWVRDHSVIVGHSDAVPLFAGFLGGLLLGATLSNAAPEGDRYYDPYCEEVFPSLVVYRTHLRHWRHPQIVRVIDHEGVCVHALRYSDGCWRDYEARAQGPGEDWDE